MIVSGVTYLKALSLTGISQYVADVVYSTPNLVPLTGVKAGQTVIQTWTDTNPASTRKYRILVDTVVKGATQNSTVRQSEGISGMAVGNRTIALQWWDTGDGTVFQQVSYVLNVASNSRMTQDTVISNITTTGWVASITFSEGVKIRNYVDVMNPPVALYSTQNDFDTAAHASPISGRAPGSTYYIQQIAEFTDGTFEAGTSTQVITEAAGVSTPSLTQPNGNVAANHTQLWSDPTPPSTRRFRVKLNGSDVSGVLGNAIRQFQFSGLTDGNKTVVLEYFPESTPNTVQSVSINITVGAVVTPTDSVLRPVQFTSVQGGWSDGSTNMPAYQEQRTETNAGFRSGTKIRRMSNDGGVPVYSKRSVYNSTSTMGVASNARIFRTSDGASTGYFAGVGPRNEFNWSYVDPNIMFGVSNSSQNTFVKRNVVTGSVTTLRQWSQYDYLTMGDFEGCQSSVGSAADRYVCLIGYSGNNRTHISYDIQTNTVLGTKTAESLDNWSGFSHDGNFILVEKNLYPNPDRYLTFYDKNFNQLRRVFLKPEHGDWAVDKAGNQVYAMMTGNGVNYVIANTGQVVTAFTGGFAHGHMSGRNVARPGYCYASSASAGGPVLEVELAPGGKVALAALPRCNEGNYDSVPSPNSTASKIAYRTNYMNSGTFTTIQIELPPA